MVIPPKANAAMGLSKRKVSTTGTLRLRPELTCEQELEPDTQVCDECARHHTKCVWLEDKGHKACISCSNRRVKCLIDGTSVTNWTSKKNGSPIKR